MTMAETESPLHSAKRDFATGIVLFVVSAIGAWSISTNKFITDVEYGNDPGPGLVPGLMLGFLAASSIAMMVIARVRLRRLRQAGLGDRSADKACSTWLVPALMVTSLVLYSQSMMWLGFLESTIVFALLWTVALGVQDNGRPDLRRSVIWLLEGCAICAGIYAVFAWFIQIPLP
jgi:hypothetical protein